MPDHCAYPKCGKELTHIEGRRKKKYCDQNCNTRHWKMLHPTYKPQSVMIKKDKLVEDTLYSWRNGELVAIKESLNHLFETGISITETTENGVRAIHPFSDEGWKVQGQAKIQERISQIEEMLKMPPKYLPKDKRTKLQTELSELKSQLLKLK